MNVTRRQVVQAGAALVPAVLAGCSDASVSIEVVKEAEHLSVEGVRLYQDIPSKKATLSVIAESLQSVDAIVWVGPGGGQIGAERYRFGDREVSIFSPLDGGYSSVMGTNTVAAVRGGETDCFGEACSHTGGESVETVEFEIQRA